MRHARIQQAKPERSFVERIVAVIVAIAMLGGMGYATTSAAMADDDGQTLEKRAGIKLGLHDYDRKTINDKHALKFMSVGDSGTYNRYVGNGNGAYTGIVNKTLTDDGYPTVADKQESLDYLFDETSDSVVTSYKPTGGLLKPEGDGYYGFDANSQYATYNKELNKFDLSPQNSCANQTDTPCFTPFGNNTDENRYSFGMNLGADFYMPKDGKVNNQDMVFDFTGDDDVWVFIDGVLVLDLGGIHQALSGKIDFATGEITYDKTQRYGDRPAATITDAFANAGETWDSTAYKTHHLSFFYLERGDGGSNCKIRFNLPVKPSKAIDIEKETLGTIDANKQFQFQLFVGSSSTPYQGKYSVYDAYTNQVVQSYKSTGDNGVITLAKGQFARVQSDSFTETTPYKVRELNSSGYTVFANDAPMTQRGSGDNAYAETGPFTVGTTGHVRIVNSNVKPSNNKSIEKTDGGAGDEYTLHLTASGDSTSSTVTTATPADIVLVMDKSGSMKGELDKNAKEAANALAGKLLTTENSNLPENRQVRMAVVTFSTHAAIEQNFTTDVSKINSAVEGDPEGGTNWEAALKKANDALKKANDALKKANDLPSRSNVKKHIIFLSDGDPTYRISTYPIGCDGWWTPCNPDDKKINRPKGVHGAGREGSDNRYGYNYAAALAEANKRGDAALYVVKTSTDAKKMANLAIEANAVNGKEFDGTNAKNLTKAFDQIYSTITSSAKIKVFSITDTLSKWVDPVDFPNATNGTDITQHVTVKNGSTTMPTSEYKATYSVDNFGNRTVTVTFNGTDGTDGIVAEKADNIDVSFKVKPSDAAYADYAKNNKQYPDKGDANTGTESAERQGYHSNADAKLNYCVLIEVNGKTPCGKTIEAEYPHPVIQVVSSKLHIEKQWSGEGSKPKSITVDIKQGDDTYKRVTLEPDTDGNWSTDVIIPAGAAKTYTVTETEPENHQWKAFYQYKVGDDDFVDGNTVTVPASTASQTATVRITNKQALVTLPANSVSVTKQVIGSTTARDFSFTMVATGDNAKNVTWPKGQTSSKVTIESVTSAEEKTASFSDKLTFPARDATYTFQVTEDKPQKHIGWKYDDSTKTVRVTVTYDERQGKWIATANPANVTFTNHYIAVSALPLTGGMTDRQWLFVGGVVGGLAVLLIGAAGVWNGKKRLV